jgi:hypothetical protein
MEKHMTARMRFSRLGLMGGLAAASFVVGCAAEDGAATGAGDPAPPTTELQRRVDDVLASIPGGQQVSATEIDYDGLTVTFDPSYVANQPALSPASIACSNGWFCINVQGTAFAFFKCQMWDLSNWLNNAPFNNNQTPGTVARAYDNNFNQIWSNTAKASGTVNVTPWWHFKPC